MPRRASSWWKLTFADLVARVGSVSGVPAGAPRAVAALFEHYGRRAEEPPHRTELRHALIRYLDRCEPERRKYDPPTEVLAHCDPDLAAVAVTDELPRHLDDAEILLNTL